MVLVSGATGLLGGEICRLLAEAGSPVQALVRPTADSTKIENLKALGIPLVEGDLKDPSSLGEACKGVDAIVSTASSTFSRQEGDSIETVDKEGQIRLIDAAKGAGVERFVYVSFRNDPTVQYPLTLAKRAVEKQLRESGLSYTILQASWFMEVWLSPAVGFDHANAQAQIYGDGHNKISWVSFKDVARFAVASLSNPAARNAVLEIGGPEPLSPLEVVRTFEDVGSRPFTVSHLSKEQLQSQKSDATDPLQESFAGLMIQYANGDVIDMAETAQRYQVQLTSVRDYALSVLGD